VVLYQKGLKVHFTSYITMSAKTLEGSISVSFFAEMVAVFPTFDLFSSILQ
jgi:hypothetical protein